MGKKRMHTLVDEPWLPDYIREKTSEAMIKAIPNMAKELKVDRRIIWRWMNERPELLKAYKQGVHEWWEKIFGIMLECYDKGMSDHEVAREIGISYECYQQWISEGVNEAFIQAYQLGRTFSRAWWDKQGRENLSARNFNASIYIWSMKMRFGLFDQLMIPGFEKDYTDLDTQDRSVQSIEVRLKKIISHEIKEGKTDAGSHKVLDDPGEEQD